MECGELLDAFAEVRPQCPGTVSLPIDCRVVGRRRVRAGPLFKGSSLARDSSPRPDGFAHLTGREWQIILDAIDSPTANAAAVKRGRSPHTVHNQLKSIFRKLSVHSVPELFSLLLRVSGAKPNPFRSLFEMALLGYLQHHQWLVRTNPFWRLSPARESSRCVAASRATTLSQGLTMTPQHVLVVEDNDTTAAFVCQQLVEGGLVPETVRGGLEALRKVHSQAFALAIVDVDIASEPDGVETADWLRRLYGVPVVVFSMRGDTELRHRAAVAGPAGYVVHPEAGELSGVVANVLSAVLSRRTWSDFVAGDGTGPGYSARPSQPVGVVADRPQQAQSESKGRAAMPPGFAELSGREWQIIRDLIETPTAHAVALKRQRSPHTVHNHLKSIFRKLHVHSVAELLSLMIRLSRQVPIL